MFSSYSNVKHFVRWGNLIKELSTRVNWEEFVIVADPNKNGHILKIWKFVLLWAIIFFFFLFLDGFGIIDFIPGKGEDSGVGFFLDYFKLRWAVTKQAWSIIHMVQN